MGAQGTRAIDAAKRAGVPHTVHEYAHDQRASLHAGGRGYALEAVDALGIDAARVFKTIVVTCDGRLGLAVVPADAEVDLKAVADALGGREDVAALQDQRDRPFLDGRRDFVALLLDSLEEVRGEPQLFEVQVVVFLSAAAG